MSTDDAFLVREQLIASIAQSQCMKLCQTLDGVRDFLALGEVGDTERRSQADVDETRQAVESRLVRFEVIVAALSTMGMDAELGHLALSKTIRSFWGNWTIAQVANVRQVLKNQKSSFQAVLASLKPLLAEQELFQRYLSDIKNRRDHGDDVLAFLGRHLGSSTDEHVSLMLLHGRQRYATLLGVAKILGVSTSQARRVIKRLKLGQSAVKGRHGIKLYSLGELVTGCRREKIPFAEHVAKEFSEEMQLFRSLTP